MNQQHDNADLRQRNIRLALLLGLVALAFFGAFFLVMLSH